MAVVVLPTPPFWFATAMTCPMGFRGSEESALLTLANARLFVQCRKMVHVPRGTSRIHLGQYVPRGTNVEYPDYRRTILPLILIKGSKDANHMIVSRPEKPKISHYYQFDPKCNDLRRKLSPRQRSSNQRGPHNARVPTVIQYIPPKTISTDALPVRNGNLTPLLLSWFRLGVLWSGHSESPQVLATELVEASL